MATGLLGQEVYKIGGAVTSPKVMSKREPEYSELARKLGVTGEVWFRVVVGEDGVPRDLAITKAAGYGLDERAMESVRTWRFSPGQKDGKPAAVQVTLAVSFHILGKNKLDAHRLAFQEALTKVNDPAQHAEAVAAIEKAAKERVWEAFQFLAVSYEQGSNGFAQDDKRAREILEGCAKNTGAVVCRLEAGRLLLKSAGNDRDEIRSAHAWLELAVEQGSAEAKALLATVPSGESNDRKAVDALKKSRRIH
jgi:TonB family protein